MKLIKIKYLTDKIDKIEKINNGDWIDLRNAEDIDMKAGEFKLIPLGVVIQLPEGYEALLLPRSSTFKKYGLILANSMGVIDNSYRGPEDQWFFAAYATRDIQIPANTRIAQFRIIENQPSIFIEEIDEIKDPSRGGFGSTGTN